LFKSHCRQNNKDASENTEDRYPQPPGHYRIIGNHYVPWYPGKYYGKKPEHERQ
jgi:hypothetical protein